MYQNESLVYWQYEANQILKIEEVSIIVSWFAKHFAFFMTQLVVTVLFWNIHFMAFAYTADIKQSMPYNIERLW